MALMLALIVLVGAAGAVACPFARPGVSMPADHSQFVGQRALLQAEVTSAKILADRTGSALSGGGITDYNGSKWDSIVVRKSHMRSHVSQGP
jgi:hypothetical protein